MSFEDLPEQEATGAALTSMPDAVIPLIPPASKEPFYLLIFGILCFVVLLLLSWRGMEKLTTASSHKPKQETRDVYQLSVEARYQTYIVELLQQQQLHGPLAGLPIFKDSVTQAATQAADAWQEVVDANSSGNDKARELINVAALQGVMEQNTKAHETLLRAAKADAHLAAVVHELLPLYAHPARAVPFSAPTERVLKRLSSSPLLLARQAQVRGDSAGALAALRPGAAAGVRAIIFQVFSVFFVGGVLITAFCIGAAKYPQIILQLREVSKVEQPDLPWGPGTALVLICLVFLGTNVLGGFFIHHWDLKSEQMKMLVGMVVEIVSFVLVLGSFLLLLGRKPWDWSVFGWQRSLRGVRLAVLTLLCASPLVWLAGLLAARLFEKDDAPNPLIPMLQNAHTFAFQLLLVLMAVVMAPVVEETLFRGLLFRALGVRLPFWSAALISAVLFALIHGQAVAILPITVLGLALAFIIGRKQNLLASVTAHALHNGYVTIITLLSAWALHGPG